MRNKAGEVSGGAWKGEERAARSFVFVRRDEVPKPVMAAAAVKKRKRGGQDDDDDDDDEDDE